MPYTKTLLLLATMTLLAPSRADSQAIPADVRLRVFIDCAVSGCDSEYFRTEIAFVDHVRDRVDSDVHVLVTSEKTGGGGNQYSINFLGRRTGSRSDTLYVSTPQSASADDRRKALVRAIKLGLVPYLSRLAISTDLNVVYSAPKDGKGDAGQAARDPWNLWVYRIGANSNFSGESSQRFAYLGGSTSASRTTEDWKISIRGNGSYNESKFTFSDKSRFANYSHSYGASELVVKSMTPQWSLGQRASFSSSTFLNQKANIRVAPAIEYNFFPYKESTRRQLTLQYTAGVSHYVYEEETIFGKLKETHPDHSLTAALDLKRPWGTVSSSLEGASLLDDFSKKRLVSYTSLNLRLLKGLNLNVYSSVSWIRDQLYVPGGDLTDEEVLLRRRQLATSYRYFGGIGLSYTFGSIFNNVVNSRFGGAGGGFMFFE